MHRPPLRTFALTFIAAAALIAQTDSKLYQAMRWRQIGPFRAGRVTAVAGIPGNAAVYYMGTPGGGVWKTVSGGTVWNPIFDDVPTPTSSIGAIQVSLSNPNIVYVGTGDVSMVGGSVNFGDGVYRSADAGKTWKHIGLDETEHIGNMWVHPTNPDIVLVAALGRTYSKNENRGVFKTTDGGKTWKKVLYKDDVTGAVDIVFAPGNPQIGYTALMEHYTRPGARAAIDSTGAAGVYKTTDGGDTWTPLTEGLPTGRLGRIGVATSSDGRKVFAIVAGTAGAGGLYRSDDGGAHFAKSTPDTRITGNGYFSRVFLDPNNSDIVYVAQTSLYRSSDGGKTFDSYKGAPGGDDNHALWIDPKDSNRMMMASDQGGTISMDGGKSWSSWYNQPTGQIYHLSTDNRYPYWVYGTQQDSGSVGTLSRGDYGEITFMDWDPVGGYEFGYIVPDPLNNNLVYAGGPSRGIVRIDRTNRQVAAVSPAIARQGADAEFRTAQNPPLGFSPTDPHILYYGTQFLIETRDGGVHWKKLSPDLTTRKADAPPPAEPEPPKTGVNPPVRPRAQEQQETIAPMNRSAIETFSPSPVSAAVIWAGTNNGVVQMTKDGGATWTDVSPAGLGALTEISMVEASHFDAATAYLAVDRHSENDFRPHFYRTRDFGRTWQETSSGIPDGSFSRVLREDPVRKGLLYAGTETATFVSVDDGDHWSSLRLNMPLTSIRDLVIHNDDLVAATYGRAFWILDDVTPLRQIDKTTSTQTLLFRPEKALRVRLDLNQDTPLPPEMPAGQNPPTGAIIDYYLNSAPAKELKLAIYDSANKLVRELTPQDDLTLKEPPPNVPDYWLGHPEKLTQTAGQNRYVWDLRYAAPPVLRHEYPISALYGNTPALPLGALVTPGNYKVRLTVDGKTYEQPLVVSMDPRVDVSSEALASQFDLENRAIDLVASSFESYKKAVGLRQTLADDQKELEKRNATSAIALLKEFDQKAQRLQGSDGAGFGGGGGGGRGGRQSPAFAALNRSLGSLVNVVDGQDAAPTPVMETAYQGYCAELATAAKSWNELMKTDLANLNGELAKQGLGPLSAAPVPVPACK
jgi:photosystem II stability/assembly factor-like uncharacterized protein